MSRANTLDLYVLDVGTRWIKHQRELAEGITPTASRKPLSQEEMKAMIERAKNFKPKERKND